jgi:hypothetical protein
MRMLKEEMPKSSLRSDTNYILKRHLHTTKVNPPTEARMNLEKSLQDYLTDVSEDTTQTADAAFLDDAWQTYY